MSNASILDSLFQKAVAIIDAGDLGGLRACLTANPGLACERLESPGSWLREQIGQALDSFFSRPYLLWFIAEDPVRAGSLPPNIAELALAIVEAGRRCGEAVLQEQLDYAVSLVAWSGVARKTGHQLELLDVLADAGARLEGAPENALVNGHFEAAQRLVERGAPLTLASAVCLERWKDADALLSFSDAEDMQFALVLAALNGRIPAIKRVLPAIADVNRPSSRLYSHATPLHHAVWSGSVEAVRILVIAGGDLAARDRVYEGTPLGWAEHALGEARDEDRIRCYREIGDYLRRLGAPL